MNISLKDMDGKTLKIGDTIRFFWEDKEMVKKVTWNEEFLSVMIGNLTYQTIRDSGYYQSQIQGKAYFDFEIINR